MRTSQKLLDLNDALLRQTRRVDDAPVSTALSVLQMTLLSQNTALPPNICGVVDERLLDARQQMLKQSLVVIERRVAKVKALHYVSPSHRPTSRCTPAHHSDPASC